MTKLTARVATVLGLLLTSSASMAATVTITASTLAPLVGEQFTVTVTADVPNARAATMGLSFNALTVAYVSGAGLSPWGRFIKNSPTTQNPTVFNIEGPVTSADPEPYGVAILTFTALASGDARIVINDDGGNVSGWFAPTSTYIPVTYQQANVQVVPLPPAMLLLGTSLVSLGSLARRRARFGRRPCPTYRSGISR